MTRSKKLVVCVRRGEFMEYYYDELKIRNELARQKWRLKDFAQKAGLSPATARAVMTGGKCYSNQTLGKVAAALNIVEPISLLTARPVQS